MTQTGCATVQFNTRSFADVEISLGSNAKESDE
jgi:hypothetical protein